MCIRDSPCTPASPGALPGRLLGGARAGASLARTRKQRWPCPGCARHRLESCHARPALGGRPVSTVCTSLITSTIALALDARRRVRPP
eukprot:8819438-Alexandrium_andersonii.AAC.1